MRYLYLSWIVSVVYVCLKITRRIHNAHLSVPVSTGHFGLALHVESSGPRRVWRHPTRLSGGWSSIADGPPGALWDLDWQARQ